MSRYKMYRHELAWCGGNNYSLKIWMCDTYAPILAQCFPRIAFSFTHGEKGTCSTRLQLSQSDERELRGLLEIFRNHLLLVKNEHIQSHFTDEFDHCLALDYNFRTQDGSADHEYTESGALEHAAKESRDPSACERLAGALKNIIDFHPLYRSAHLIVPIPPNPSKTYHLPAILSSDLARLTGMRDGTGAIRKLRDTPRLQCLSLHDKLLSLQGELEPTESFVGQNVIVVDDLYQSGSTMWSVARVLKNAGAQMVLGLACVKSWRDTDNQ